MADKSGVASAIAVFKDGLATIRDGILVVIFILLLAFPTAVNKSLVAAGFVEGNIAGFKWQKQIAESSEQTKNAGQVVSELQSKLDEYGQTLKELSAQTHDPTLQSSIKKLSDEIQGSQGSARTADTALKASLLTQQAVLDQVSSQDTEERGWIFTGRVSEDHKLWAEGSPENIEPTSPEMKAGTTLVVREDVYLRGDVASGSHALAPVLTAIRSGASVQVIDVDYSHAKAGGWYLWAKVKRLNNAR